jgi:glycine/D-amino acid oxidase-like deaminating enzyme
MATCDVLVVGSGNVDLWTVYQLARRSYKRAAVRNEQSETQRSVPERSSYRMRDVA